MPIKIIHTADNHLGITFQKYPDEVRKRLLQERLDALKAFVDEGNSRDAHFLVIAGDLFDRTTVQKSIVDDAVKVLKGFEGEAVLVLAGNHDHLDSASGSDKEQLWQRFQKAAEGSRVHALLKNQIERFEIDGQAVHFYPCPCPTKTGTEHVLGWIDREEKQPDAIRIGVAHGNVEGLGMDNDNRYFNMTETALRSAGMHTWLLGHIHVASPAPGISGRQTFYMAGIHTPDSVKCTRAGHAWFLEIEADGSIRHESLQPAKVDFKRITRELMHQNDIETLRQECQRLDLSSTMLDLQLSGRLADEERQLLMRTIASLREQCLHLTEELSIHPVFDAAAIEKLFPKETLPHRLLTALAEDEKHPGDVHLALELITEIKRS